MSRNALLVIAGLATGMLSFPADGWGRTQQEDLRAVSVAAAAARDGDPRPVPTPGERLTPLRPGEYKFKYWQEEGVSETVVDDGGDIYRKRRYQGVIPHLRDRLRDKRTSKVHKRGKMEITWVGFQQMALSSRVFVQTDRMPTYTIFKPDPLHIVVEFPTARFRTRQERRVVHTHEFNTRVDRIEAKRTRGHGVHVIITLKEPTGYLYKQEGDYVFIDVER